MGGGNFHQVGPTWGTLLTMRSEAISFADGARTALENDMVALWNASRNRISVLYKLCTGSEDEDFKVLLAERPSSTKILDNLMTPDKEGNDCLDKATSCLETMTLVWDQAKVLIDDAIASGTLKRGTQNAKTDIENAKLFVSLLSCWDMMLVTVADSSRKARKIEADDLKKAIKSSCEATFPVVVMALLDTWVDGADILQLCS